MKFFVPYVYYSIYPRSKFQDSMFNAFSAKYEGNCGNSPRSTLLIHSD